jgi:hypothetical protein
MNRRKLLTALAAAGIFGAGFGTAVLPAEAVPRTFVVTLLGGKTITVTLDVPPGTPADQITVPGVSTPIVGITEVPGSAPPSGPVDVGTGEASPSPTPGGGGGGNGGGTGGQPGGNGGQSGGEPQGGGAPKGQGGSSQKPSGRKPDAPQGDNADLVGIVKKERNRRKKPSPQAPGRNSDGTPTLDNPNFTLATPGASPIGVPNFMIEKFRIPPFLLPIYQAAGIQYGVRWEILAAINEIETDYGRNLNVSSAGALGWMQFMPASWKAFGVDANKDGVKDPYNPVDAIFAAARYLKAHGIEEDVRKAIFAYNHADWYVDSVLLRARVIGGLPSNFVGSLTGLTQARFPVYAKATYADDLSEAQLAKRNRKGNPAFLVQSSEQRRGINIYARAGAPAIAVNDGKVIRIGKTKRLGRFVQLQDVYGNTFTYGHLKKVSRYYPSPKAKDVTAGQVRRELDVPSPDAAGANGKRTAGRERAESAVERTEVKLLEPNRVADAKERLFANPFRRNVMSNGGAQQVLERGGKGFEVFSSLTRVFGIDAKSKDVELKRLKPGSRVVAGTILGRIGTTDYSVAPHLLFEIRPAGRGAPRIDPKPILDGWKLLESTAIYRAAGRNPFFGPDAKTPSIGQILLMSKDALIKRVLSNPRIEIYECGRRDVRLGQIDRRVLATLEFLAASGFNPTVTSLRCGRRGVLTTSGNVSNHVSGNAVDIAKLNGIPILGHQGKGSITELAVQRLLTLQGMMKPDEIITLMKFEGAPHAFAMGDHHDHIHIGWRPLYGTNSKAAKQVNAILKPDQWIKLIDRLKEIDNPEVAVKPSKYALKTTKRPKRASDAHKGE